MDAQTQHAITQAKEDAAHLTTTKQFPLAEETYRHVIDTVQQHEGIEATYADRYNLSNVLVMQHKYQEAEPILRDALKYLAKRPVDGDSDHFLQGQGRNAEADKLMASSYYGGREEQLQVRKQVYGLSA
ncbi:hypothetical protein E4T52_11356 [Aureobasidium sp. EXF-3400]|nr:hypothetical protein E4T51_10277 [Aureobasidium sp. EXF-12344]KAI4773669.1 hypothetical protein E4T52_11356 [Aureobasidium sp. EXF-3400]